MKPRRFPSLGMLLSPRLPPSPASSASSSTPFSPTPTTLTLQATFCTEYTEPYPSLSTHMATIRNQDSPPPTTASTVSTVSTTTTTTFSEHTSVPSTTPSIQKKPEKLNLPDDIDSSYDLLPRNDAPPVESPEQLGDKIFGAQHLSTILSQPMLLSNFADFLTQQDGDGIKTLIKYLDATKALKALEYSNAIMGGEVEVKNPALEKRQKDAFDLLLTELTSYVTHHLVEQVSRNVVKRVTAGEGDNGAPAGLEDGLGECFCLTDPRRDGNPIIFMSEEFNKITQYGSQYAVGKNCRFLHGPRTNRKTVSRLREAISAQRETSEVLVNYRRDGSSFFNLLFVAPLFDSHGILRYYIGAQVDVTQLLRNGAGMESLAAAALKEDTTEDSAEEETDVFRELTEFFNDNEIETVKMYSGRLHRGRGLKRENATRFSKDRSRSRVVLKEGTPTQENTNFATSSIPPSLKGIYKNYLLVRPYPSLKILFTSPSMRTPDIHQAHLLNKIGGSNRVKEELTSALVAGRGVTAKVLWLSNRDIERGGPGTEKWLHCTPLLDGNREIGVYMVLVVDPSDYRRPIVESYSPRTSSSQTEAAAVTKNEKFTSNGSSFVNRSQSVDRLHPRTAEKRHLPLTPATSPPSSPIPRIIRQEVEVSIDENSTPPEFKLSNNFPHRRQSRNWATKQEAEEKSAVDSFAKTLGMLAAN